MIDGLRFDTQHLPLPELVDHVIAHSTLITHYQADKEGQDRIENLHELVNAAAAFTQIEGHAVDATALRLAATLKYAHRCLARGNSRRG